MSVNIIRIPKKGLERTMKTPPLVVATILAGALASGTASADEMMSGKGFYIGASGAVSFVDDFDFTNGRSNSNLAHTIEWDTGYGGILRGGYDYGDIRAEVELDARRVDIDKIDDQGNPSGDSMLYSAMLNGAWDIDTGTEFTPYISLGIGAVAADGDLAYDCDNNNVITQEVEDFAGIALAGQAGLGVAYAINKEIDVTAGYSLMAAPTDDSGASETLLAHSGLIGLNYKF